MDSGPGDTSSSSSKTKTPLVELESDDDGIIGNPPEVSRGRRPSSSASSLSSSSSSSSSNNSDSDFFQIDPAELEKAMQADTSPMQIEQSSLFDGREQQFRFQQATQSPEVQVMGRCDVPDPNRIPSSIFARTKSTTPMEWSVASNESLFSIHMGNSSFSRDHIFLSGCPSPSPSPIPIPMDSSSFSPSRPPLSPQPMSMLMPVPTRTPDFAPPTPSHSPSPSVPTSPPLPPISPVASPPVSPIPLLTDAEDHGLAQPDTTANEGATYCKDVVLPATAREDEHEDSQKTKSAPPAAAAAAADLGNITSAASISRQSHSDSSTTSFRSFAFPILTGEGRSGSINKVEPEPQQQPQSDQQQTPKTQTPKTVPAPNTKGWLSCFSCCPFCR